jgi:hypothetical protein
MLPYHRGRTIPWWAIALVALACAGLVWLVVRSGGGARPVEVPAGTVDAVGGGPGVGDGSSPSEPTSSVSSRFARPAVGARVQLRVLSLGDDPSRCEAVSLRVEDEVRTAYHHRCEGHDGDLAFFLLRLTGMSKDPVMVRLDGFELITADGRALAARNPQDVSKRFPEEIALGLGASRKGWVVFDLRGEPVGLRYTDGDQALTVRFPGTWL